MDPSEIRQIRERLGITQHELGHMLGVAPNTVSRWENGDHPPDRLRDQMLRQLREEVRQRENANEWGRFLASLALGAGIGAVLGTLFKDQAREPDD